MRVNSKGLRLPNGRRNGQLRALNQPPPYWSYRLCGRQSTHGPIACHNWSDSVERPSPRSGRGAGRFVAHTHASHGGGRRATMDKTTLVIVGLMALVAISCAEQVEPTPEPPTPTPTPQLYWPIPTVHVPLIYPGYEEELRAILEYDLIDLILASDLGFGDENADVRRAIKYEVIEEIRDKVEFQNIAPPRHFGLGPKSYIVAARCKLTIRSFPHGRAPALYGTIEIEHRYTITPRADVRSLFWERRGDVPNINVDLRPIENR